MKLSRLSLCRLLLVFVLSVHIISSLINVFRAKELAQRGVKLVVKEPAKEGYEVLNAEEWIRDTLSQLLTFYVVSAVISFGLISAVVCQCYSLLIFIIGKVVVLVIKISYTKQSASLIFGADYFSMFCVGVSVLLVIWLVVELKVKILIKDWDVENEEQNAVNRECENKKKRVKIKQKSEGNSEESF